MHLRSSADCAPPLRVRVLSTLKRDVVERAFGVDEVTEQLLEPTDTEKVPSVQEEIFEQSPEQMSDVDMVFPQEQVSGPVVEQVVGESLRGKRSALLWVW